MRNQLASLTSLRFFAAAMIVIQHSAGYFGILDGFASRFHLSQGVTFFFVLSGFILTYAYGNLSGPSNVARFIWARISRIWPAHITTMLLFYVLWSFWLGDNYSPTSDQFWMNALLLQSWSQLPYTFFGFNGVAWSLSNEMFFYAMFPFLLWNFEKAWPHIIVICASLIGLAFFFCHNYNLTAFTGTNIPNVASWAYIWPPARLLEFVLGMAAGKLFVCRGSIVSAIKQRTAIDALGLALIIGGAIVVPELGKQLTVITSFDLALASWILISGSAPFFAAGLFFLASASGAISKILSGKHLILLGEISFSIYLIHQIVIRAMIENPEALSFIPKPIQMIGYWISVIVFSYLLWRFVEKPCQRFMVGLFKKPSLANSSELQKSTG